MDWLPLLCRSLQMIWRVSERVTNKIYSARVRPPATHGYGPTPTRENYMGMGTWNGGVTLCGRCVGSKVIENIFKRQTLSFKRSDSCSILFYLVLMCFLALYAVRPFDLQQAQHRVRLDILETSDCPPKWPKYEFAFEDMDGGYIWFRISLECFWQRGYQRWFDWKRCTM